MYFIATESSTTTATATAMATATRKEAESKHKHPKRSTATITRDVLGTLLRLVLLDIPYLAILVAAIGVALFKNYQETYYDPLLDTLTWTDERAEQEMTYYGRMCSAQESTADSPEQLILSEDMTPEEVVDSMLTHGVSIFPNLMKPETASALRDTILEYNDIEDNFGVISNNNRWSYGIRMEQHPVVRQALREVASNPLLRKTLKPLLGDNPALYKLHAITSAYGAANQRWHWDVMAESSSQQYSRSFAPLYTLFIPLQDVPSAMGVTQMCPGSHVCADGTAFCQGDGGGSFEVLFGMNSTLYPDEKVWPATYGALMNQQTTHRGQAHTMEDGPNRVLFTLAITPRPRSNHISQLETRSLSLGGSYAIHYTQWAHTWNDFLDETMYNPIKTIRSWGFYKPRNTQWGRDFPFTVLLQLANGHYDPDLEEFFHGGNMGLWNVIPKYLHARYPTEEEIHNDTDDPGLIWYGWMVETLRNCRNELERWALLALAVYNITIVSVNVLMCSLGFMSTNTLLRNLQNWFLRIIVVHVIVALCTTTFFKQMHDTPWARHMRSGKEYTLSKNYRGPILPSTLPNEKDILMLDDFQSDYLASYTRMYAVAHPGNAAWRVMVDEYAKGFDNLPPSLQSSLCANMVDWAGQDHRRFLIKNNVNQWARMTTEMSTRFVHIDMMRASNHFIDKALQQITFLQSETKFGTWRETAMHRHDIPALLLSLTHKLAKFKMTQRTHKYLNREPLEFLPRRRFSIPDLTGKLSDDYSSRGLPNKATVQEPFWGAWLQVGDKVDYLEDNEGEYRWYRGEIVHTLANEMRWVVSKEHAPGEQHQQYTSGHDEIRSCYHCVKPLIPLAVNEEVQFKGLIGKVVQVNDVPENTVNFRSHQSGFVRRHVPFWEISRLAPIDDMPHYRPTLQEQVLIYNSDEDEWNIGLVVSVFDKGEDSTVGNDDGPHYTVSTDNGPEFFVKPENLRPLHFAAEQEKVDEHDGGDDEDEDDEDDEEEDDDEEDE